MKLQIPKRQRFKYWTLIFLEFALFFIASVWLISGAFMIFSFLKLGEPHLTQIPIVLVPTFILGLIGIFLRKIRKSLLSNSAEE
jgi:drug/metabolite transporter superfamily protein YnfA